MVSENLIMVRKTLNYQDFGNDGLSRTYFLMISGWERNHILLESLGSASVAPILVFMVPSKMATIFSLQFLGLWG